MTSPSKPPEESAASAEAAPAHGAPEDESAAPSDGADDGDGDAGDEDAEPTSGDESRSSESGTRGPLLTPTVACGLAALGGALYFTGMPGPGFWPAAFVAQAPFYLALLRQSPRRAALLGLLNGFTFSLGTFYWLFGTVNVFGGFPAPVSLLVMFLMCAYQGGRAALTGWLTARAEARGWPPALAFVLAFGAGELLYPLLFPWYFSVTALGAPWFVQAADLGGPILAGALLLGSSLALAELVRARIDGDRASRALVLGGLLAPLLSGIYGFVRVRQVEAMQWKAPWLNVGLAQGNLPLVGRNAGVRINRLLTKDLRDQGADFVVWSEGSVPDVFDEEVYREETYKRISRGLGVPVFIGGGVKRRTGDRVREFNTTLFTDAEGQVVGRYDKHFLLPFGEYMPFGDRFPSLYDLSPHSSKMSPGESLDPVILDGHPITVIICYEDLLPTFVNQAVRHGKPELLVNMTIDTWFGDTIAPWEHLGLAQLRAVEHRRYLVRATNSGVSAIVDATGRITKHGGLFKEETLLGEVRFMAPTTLYERIGDVPFWAGSAIVGAMAFVRRRRKPS
ncbi:Apolipoprotein N-acyltransferase [Minicystis rosea]|nr:Apolipoprotein N-acyltransferase [Minicystis rosea]